jgi:hypothetical protein
VAPDQNPSPKTSAWYSTKNYKNPLITSKSKNSVRVSFHYAPTEFLIWITIEKYYNF